VVFNQVSTLDNSLEGNSWQSDNGSIKVVYKITNHLYLLFSAVTILVVLYTWILHYSTWSRTADIVKKN